MIYETGLTDQVICVADLVLCEQLLITDLEYAAGTSLVEASADTIWNGQGA